TRFSLPDNWSRKVSEAKQFLFQIAVEDFDADGDFDIAVATYEGIPFLLCQEGGKFVDRSRELGLGTWVSGGPTKSALAGWIDFNNDGFPDLLMGQSLYRNVGGLRFKNVTTESGYQAGFDPHGVTVADYNNDGLLDFYISRSHRYQQEVDRAGWVGDEESGTPNTLWKNLGNGKFQDVTVESHSGGGSRTTFTSSWFFFDEDHYPDLYIANDFAKNVVLRNRGDGSFEDVSDISGAADFATSMGVATGDLDNDGSTEIYVANMYSKMGRRIISHVSAADYPAEIFPQIQGSCAGNRLYRKQNQGQYSDVTAMAGVNEVGWAFAPLMCDFDGDGLLDLYATTGFMSFNREKPDG
ncbi:MAG: VCBS repeat-containing protein, partial [Planctomycetota bacterium]|nr:VCBS repeat-containing protein [Planctomycetota bacterium]